MKLYKVSTKKFSAYVVAKDLNSAWEKFKIWLNAGEGYGFSSDREFESIEEIADSEVRCLPDNITNFKNKLFVDE